MTRPSGARLAGLLLMGSAAAARATPNIPLEDPVYLELARLRAEGKLPAYLGGARPLTEAEVHSRQSMQPAAAQTLRR